tara:strand:- start:64 stop:267 length:204 start_codon:yes stop_codon:yes gene_type:complete
MPRYLIRLKFGAVEAEGQHKAATMAEAITDALAGAPWDFDKPARSTMQVCAWQLVTTYPEETAEPAP